MREVCEHKKVPACTCTNNKGDMGNPRSGSPSCQEHLAFQTAKRASLSLCSKTVTLRRRGICRNVKNVSEGSLSLHEEGGKPFREGRNVVRRRILPPTRPSSWPRRLSHLSSTESRTGAARKLILHQCCRPSRPALISASLIYCTRMARGVQSVSASLQDKWPVMAAWICPKIRAGCCFQHIFGFCSDWINKPAWSELVI